MEKLPVPDEIIVGRIKYTKGFIIYAVLFVVGISLCFFGDMMIYIGAGFSALIILLAIRLIMDSRDNAPHIILNNKGITTRNAGFVAWKNIQNEWVGFSNERRNMGDQLRFEYVKEDGTRAKEQIDLNGKNYSVDDIGVFVKVFRERYHRVPEQ